MIPQDQISNLTGMTVKGADGEKLGKVSELYVDREGGQPTFATVHTGLFGTHSSFVPLDQATIDGDDLLVPYGKDLVSEAPRLEEGDVLQPTDEDRLYRHYGIAGGAPSGQGTVGHDTSGPTTDDAMTRSEERLHVGTEEVQTGVARLRKHVVSETETRTVPVAHDEVRIEREPITASNVDKAMDGPAISEEEHEVVLTEERPVVAKEAVPVERVRLETDRVTEQETVSETVRKEQIEAEGVYPTEEPLRAQEPSRS